MQHDSETLAEGQQVFTACAFLWREENGVKQVFLARRASTKKFLPSVWELPGGHIKYGEAYGDDGLWEGNLYVFDGRMGMNFSDKAKVIGQCIHCAGKTSNYENCANPACNDLVLICKTCLKDPAKRYHTEACSLAKNGV